MRPKISPMDRGTPMAWEARTQISMISSCTSSSGWGMLAGLDSPTKLDGGIAGAVLRECLGRLSMECIGRSRLPRLGFNPFVCFDDFSLFWTTRGKRFRNLAKAAARGWERSPKHDRDCGNLFKCVSSGTTGGFLALPLSVVQLVHRVVFDGAHFAPPCLFEQYAKFWLAGRQSRYAACRRLSYTKGWSAAKISGCAGAVWWFCVGKRDCGERSGEKRESEAGNRKGRIGESGKPESRKGLGLSTCFSSPSAGAFPATLSSARRVMGECGLV